MQAYFLDSFFGFFSWAVLLLIVFSLIKLFKRKSIKTMNFKIIALVSLLGIISPTINLLNGKYQLKHEIKILDTDELAFKEIINSCLTNERLTEENHTAFYSLVDKYKMTQSAINEMFRLFYSEDLMKLQKSFYEDALETIRSGKIHHSEIRKELENKLLNQEQINRNQQYLQDIQQKKPLEMNGEMVLLDEEMCISVIENMEQLFKVGINNVQLLKDRNSFQ